MVKNTSDEINYSYSILKHNMALLKQTADKVYKLWGVRQSWRDRQQSQKFMGAGVALSLLCEIIKDPKYRIHQVRLVFNKMLILYLRGPRVRL